MLRPLAATLLACTALAATAAPEYAGHLGLNPGAFHMPHLFNDADQHLLDHAFVFVLDQPHDAIGRAFVVPTDGFLASGAMLSLWHSNGDLDFGNDTLLGGFDFGTTPVEQRFAGLGAGEYFWRLEALVSGTYGEIQFDVDHLLSAPVPEPASHALLGLGLAALAAASRRRAGRR